MMLRNMEFFKDRKIVIATKHSKEKAMGAFLSSLGLEYFVPEDFDTDTFGTFTREVSRAGNQLEAARKKAMEAMKYTGADIAIASEGSFGPDPEMPFVSSNLELVLLVDVKHGVEVAGHYRTGDTNFSQEKVSSLQEAIDFAKKVGFPEYGVIVRKNEKSKNIYKDIVSWKDFENTVTKLLSKPFTKKIFLETDMRAHRNPTRMRNIQLAMEDLMKNVTSTCPGCRMFGYTVSEYIPGLPCRLCKQPTDIPKSVLYECAKCGNREEKNIEDPQFSDPEQCQYCNP